MALKKSLSRDQQKELRTVLKRMKLPDNSIDALLSSQNGANTYKAFRQGKKIESINGEWTINFGAKWAKKSDNSEPSHKSSSISKATITTTEQKTANTDIPQIDEDILPDAPPIEVEMPDLVNNSPVKPATDGNTMLSIQIEREYLVKLQTLAQKQGLSISQITRLAIKRFLGD